MILRKPIIIGEANTSEVNCNNLLHFIVLPEEKQEIKQYTMPT